MNFFLFGQLTPHQMIIVNSHIFKKRLCTRRNLQLFLEAILLDEPSLKT